MVKGKHHTGLHKHKTEASRLKFTADKSINTSKAICREKSMILNINVPIYKHKYELLNKPDDYAVIDLTEN